jgi:hypothetical protein
MLAMVAGLASVSAMCSKQPITPVNTTDAGPTPINPDSGPIILIDGGDSYDQACANIQLQGCSEGTNMNCAVTMRTAESTKLEYYDSNCLKAATSKTAIRACGNGKVACP